MSWFDIIFARPKPQTPEMRAKKLLAAIDAGGLPLHAGIVNDIARKIGLEVAMDAPMEVTIARIRGELAK
jgi:energy-converting hydrogenase Eha subunit F